MQKQLLSINPFNVTTNPHVAAPKPNSYDVNCRQVPRHRLPLLFSRRTGSVAGGLQPDHCAELLKALAEPLRLRIVDALRERPRNVSEIADVLGVEVMIASHHLGILKNAGFVERQKQGRFAVYKLRPGIATRGHIDLGCCQLKLPKDTPLTGPAE